MEPTPPDPTAEADAQRSETPQDIPPSAATRVGAGMSAIGGLGAIAGYALPWFVFVVAISTACRAPLQVELYNVYGAGLALGAAGNPPAALAITALACALVILIQAALSLRRPRLRRVRILLTFSLVGLGALGVLGALAARGQVRPGNLPYAIYLGFSYGFWVTVGGLLLAWIGGLALHAAARPRRERAPIGEIALASLGVMALLASTTTAIVERPAPYPSLSCARQSTAGPGSGRAVYVTSADGAYALDAASGRSVWTCRNPLGGLVTTGAPALASGALILASRDGYVFAVRASDAAILWRADIGGRSGFVTQMPPDAPIVAHGLVYGVNAAGQVYALRARDGGRAWPDTATRPPIWLTSTLLLADGAVIYLANDHGQPRLVALDDRTGHLLWQSPDVGVAFSYSTRNSQMEVDQGTAYDEEFSTATQGLYLVARSISDGAVRWRYFLSEPGSPQPPSAFTVADGVVYLEQRQPLVTSAAGPGAPRVMALRARDGTVVWSTPAPDSASNQTNLGVQVSLAVDGAEVYLASWDIGVARVTVYGFDARRGSVRWRYDVPQTSARVWSYGQSDLVVMGPTVYLLGPSGSLLLFDAHTGFSGWRFDSAASRFPWSVIPGDLAVGASTAGGSAATLAYVATTKLYAVNPVDGSVRWQFTPDTPTTPYAATYTTLSSLVSPPTLA